MFLLLNICDGWKEASRTSQSALCAILVEIILRQHMSIIHAGAGDPLYSGKGVQVPWFSPSARCLLILPNVHAIIWILRGVLLGCRMEAGPEVLSWQLLEPQLLFILVNYQDYQFAGTLMLEAR
jgi:hypothetical protein